MRTKTLSILFSAILIFCSCADELSTSNDTVSMPPASSSQTIQITASSLWSASCSDSWVILPVTNGKGNSDFQISCKDNYTGALRTAKVTIEEGKKSQTIVVNQLGGDVLLNEDFNDNTLNWTLPVDSISSNVTNSFFNIKNIAFNYSNFVGTRSMISNYTGNYLIATDFRIVSGGVFGIFFGCRDFNNLYRILVFSSGAIAVYKKTDGIYSMFYSTAVTNYQSENRLSLVKVGSLCRIYFNGYNMGSFDYSNPYGAYGGFYLVPQSEVQIHYLKINQF